MLGIILQVGALVIIAGCVWSVIISAVWFWPAHRAFMRADAAFKRALAERDLQACHVAHVHSLAAMIKSHRALLWALNPFAWRDRLKGRR